MDLPHYVEVIKRKGILTYCRDTGTNIKFIIISDSFGHRFYLPGRLLQTRFLMVIGDEIRYSAEEFSAIMLEALFNGTT